MRRRSPISKKSRIGIRTIRTVGTRRRDTRAGPSAEVRKYLVVVEQSKRSKSNSMAYDLLIKNGTVVDGTGAPQMRADIAVSGDRIVEIGNIKEGAKRVIDASDLIVSPGFVDPHTHYDAQICWDPLISCTSWHGVTSVVMGNCGVGLAPWLPRLQEIAAWDLVNVESIPIDVLSKGVTWDWESFPQYMN